MWGCCKAVVSPVTSGSITMTTAKSITASGLTMKACDLGPYTKRLHTVCTIVTLKLTGLQPEDAFHVPKKNTCMLFSTRPFWQPFVYQDGRASVGECVCECVSYSGCWADGWWRKACCSSHSPARCRCPRGVPLGRGGAARCFSSPAAWWGFTPARRLQEKQNDFRHKRRWSVPSEDIK